MSKFLRFLSLLSILIAGLPLGARALSVEPAAPVVPPGGTLKLSATDYIGAVNWTDLATKRFLGTGSSVTYTAPAQAGSYQVQAGDAQAQIVVTVTVLAGATEQENALWDIHTHRGEIFALLAADGGKTLWLGTNGGLEKREAATGKVEQVFTAADHQPAQGRAGLPGNYANALADDGAGGLWIGTDEGLARRTADGKWTVHDQSNSLIPHKAVHALLSDGAGGVWVGTPDGLARLRADGKWEIYRAASSGLPDDRITALLDDHAGGLWIGTGYGGLARRTADGEWTVHDTTDGGLPLTYITALAHDGAGGLWLGSGDAFGEGNGLARLTADGTWAVYHSDTSGLPDNRISALRGDGAGGVWVGTPDGLARLAADGVWTVYDSGNSDLPDNAVYALLGDGAGGLWVGTRNGLARRTPDGGWSADSQDSAGPPDNSILTVLGDGAGGVWLGTEHGGLARRAANGAWTAYASGNSGLPGNTVPALLGDGAGGLWVGTYDGLARLAEDGTWAVFDTGNSGLPGNTVHALLDDGAGGLWLGTGGGLARRAANGTWTVFDTDNSPLPDNNVTALFDDGAGGLWINSESGWGGGLAHLAANGTWTVHALSAHAALAGGAAGVWLGVWDGITDLTGGFYDHGLARLAADGAWTVYTLDNSGLPNNEINVLLGDGAGGLWIGTDGGLARLAADGAWTVYDTGNAGLPGRRVKALAHDDAGGLWVGTDDGLARLGFGSKPDLCIANAKQCASLATEQRSAILVYAAGGGDGAGQGLNIQAIGKQVYRNLYRRGYDHDEIRFLSLVPEWDVNDDGFMDKNLVDAPSASAADILDALVWAAGKGKLDQPLVMVYVGHGLPGQLPFTSGSLAAQTLKEWLDAYQAYTGNAVILVLESCYSGSLAQALGAPDRVVISSTGGDELAYYLGQISFTGLLFDYLAQDLNFSEAWRNATSALYAYGVPFSRQQPQLSDLSGLAPAQCLNLCGLGDLVNVVLNVSLSATQVVAGQGVTLSATPLDSRVNAVYAEVITPGVQVDEQGRPTGDTLKRALVKGGGKWQLPYSPKQDGNYLFSVQALDGEGKALGGPRPAALRVGGGPPPATGQCAVFDAAANPQVNIPCVSVNGTPYRAGLNLVAAPAGVTRFAVTSAEPASLTPAADCAVFPHGGQDVLRLNCVQVGADTFWAELGLVPGAADIQFDLSGADRR